MEDNSKTISFNLSQGHRDRFYFQVRVNQCQIGEEVKFLDKTNFLTKDRILTNDNNVRMMTLNSFGSLLKLQTIPRNRMTEADLARNVTSDPRLLITVTAEEAGAGVMAVRCKVGSVQLLLLLLLPSPQEPVS